MKLLIYLPRQTARSRYTFKTVFKVYLQLNDFEFTTDLEKYLQYEGPKFSYASKLIDGKVHFTAHGLLEERGINEQAITKGEFNGIPYLFSVRQDSVLPYDPFSAIFYMISRYEEYLPHLRDQYDRFTAKESVAKKNDFLHLPVVDHWTFQIRSALQGEFPQLQFANRKFQYISTIDIDNAYAYKEKGFLRVVGSLMRSVSRFEIKILIDQIKVLSRLKKDPFDTYNYQRNIQKKYNLKPIFFFLLGDYGLNDKNLSHENTAFQSLIRSIADYSMIGIHPSFGSNSKQGQLRREVKRLERIVKREVQKSRQHFLKLRLPETYRNLIEEDIQEDYTMGFASEMGFRAGTCTPFPFYDLDEEVECKLTVFPFQVMEATLKYYLKLPIDQSIVEIKKIIDEVKKVEGTFISLWHNESLSNEMEWEGWRKVFEEMVSYATLQEKAIA